MGGSRDKVSWSCGLNMADDTNEGQPRGKVWLVAFAGLFFQLENIPKKAVYYDSIFLQASCIFLIFLYIIVDVFVAVINYFEVYFNLCYVPLQKRSLSVLLVYFI